MKACGPGFVWHDELGRCVLPKGRPTLGWHEDADDKISPHIIDCWEQDFIPDPEGVRNLSNLLDSIRPTRMDTAREN